MERLAGYTLSVRRITKLVALGGIGTTLVLLGVDGWHSQFIFKNTHPLNIINGSIIAILAILFGTQYYK